MDNAVVRVLGGEIPTKYTLGFLNHFHFGEMSYILWQKSSSNLFTLEKFIKIFA